MNSLERVATILQHKEADRVPVYPILSGVTRKLVGASYKEWATNAEVCSKALIKAAEDYELDCICTLTDLSVEASDFGQEVIFPENEAAHPSFDNHLIKSVEDYDKVSKLNPRETPRMSEHIKLCDLLVKAKGKDTPIVAFVFGPLGITSMLRGQEDFYMDLYDEPDTVKRCMEVVNDTLIDYCDALIDTGVHAIMLDTLFASKSIMSKSMWMEFEGVYVEKLAKHIHDRGCMVMIHNCGQGIYFDVQIETMKPEAISFLHIPDDCSSFAETKEKYGHLTTLIGHIPPPWIVNASSEEVEEECKKEIDELKKNGGFILATGCEYPANASLDNAAVMVRTAKEYGRY
jgi:uroporphyrinogen decarboxylase